MKHEAELFRVGSRMYNPNGTLHTDCKTINAAKRASRAYQGGSPGTGKVRVTTKVPS